MKNIFGKHCWKGITTLYHSRKIISNAKLQCVYRLLSQTDFHSSDLLYAISQAFKVVALKLPYMMLFRCFDMFDILVDSIINKTQQTLYSITLWMQGHLRIQLCAGDFFSRKHRRRSTNFLWYSLAWFPYFSKSVFPGYRRIDPVPFKLTSPCSRYRDPGPCLYTSRAQGLSQWEKTWLRPWQDTDRQWAVKLVHIYYTNIVEFCVWCW